MDRLQLAQDRYQSLAPLLLRPLDVRSSDQWEHWLRDFVCPLVDQLRTNRQFQRLARWSPDHLASGTNTSQRRLVEIVDRELVLCARRVAEAAGSPASVVDEAPRKGRRSRTQRRTKRGAPTAIVPPPAELAASAAAWIANRPWFDLVCPQEYFDPYRGLHLLHSNPIRSAEFWKRQPLAVPLGDYVGRALFARLDFFVEAVLAEWQQAFHAASAQGESGYRMADTLFSARVRLDASLSDLRQACLAGELPRRRDACAALTQVYAAYHPSPDLAWLGCGPGAADAYGPLIRRVVRPLAEIVTAPAPAPSPATPDGGGQGPRPPRTSFCSPVVIQSIGAALAEMGALYRQPLESEDLITWARESKRLVMIERRPRSVLWEGQEVPGDWDRWPTRWDLLWKLAQRALRQQPVDREELTNAGSSSRAVVNRRYHLGKCLPIDLDSLIEDARPRGYRLKLEPREVLLLQLDSDEQLVEVGSEIRPIVEGDSLS